MNHLHKAFLFLGLILFSVCAKSASNTDPLKISQILYFSGHTGMLVQQPSMVELPECPRHDYYILVPTHPFYKEVTSLILAAHISGQKLKLTLNGCADGLPNIAHVYSNK